MAETQKKDACPEKPFKVNKGVLKVIAEICDELEQELTPKLVVPTSPVEEESDQESFKSFNEELKPKLAPPTSTDEEDCESESFKSAVEDGAEVIFDRFFKFIKSVSLISV